VESTQISDVAQPCALCDSQAAKNKSECPTINLGSISYLGARYHELDFIYAINEQDEDAPYMIAQVLSFSQDHTSQSVQVQIRQLRHYDDLVQSGQTPFNIANWKKDEVFIGIYLFFCSNVIALA